MLRTWTDSARMSETITFTVSEDAEPTQTEAISNNMDCWRNSNSDWSSPSDLHV